MPAIDDMGVKAGVQLKCVQNIFRPVFDWNPVAALPLYILVKTFSLCVSLLTLLASVYLS